MSITSNTIFPGLIAVDQLWGKVSPPFTHTVLYYYYTQWYPIASSPAHTLTAWDVSTARFEL